MGRYLESHGNVTVSDAGHQLVLRGGNVWQNLPISHATAHHQNVQDILTPTTFKRVAFNNVTTTSNNFQVDPGDNTQVEYLGTEEMVFAFDAVMCIAVSDKVEISISLQHTDTLSVNTNLNSMEGCSFTPTNNEAFHMGICGEVAMNTGETVSVLVRNNTDSRTISVHHLVLRLTPLRLI
eukprot:NODE_2049_length_1215_cov_27.497427_g1702_i0.p1 GENE.NODE_2049_length_1215_cov_27.497427_g1702_i0~~NODE_2049_length_1215_cov_27.497427_g1702_i0.p1  ORF type:complete len:180 (-),score=6.91 NODE_2049_length_1215_cov_27.497427_g1702_i0:49-588(-)